MNQDRQTVRPRQEAAGVYRIEVPTPFSVGPVNVYLVEGENLTLVDAGPLTEPAWTALTGGIREIGYDWQDVRQVVLTHHHVDHSGLLERVRRASGARIMAHPLARPYVTLDESFLAYFDRFFYELYRQCGVPEQGLAIVSKYHRKILTYSERSHIDVLLRHEQPVPGLSDWQVLYTPGHAQSHLSLYRASDRVMIAGDHIIKHISSNAFIEPPQDRGGSRPLTLVQYRTALEMCADMEIDLVLSGHGEPVTEHRELILQRLQRNWERTSTLRRLLKDGEKTVYELSALLFPDLYERELPLTLSETLGHIDLLTILHQVESQERYGVLYYSL